MEAQRETKKSRAAEEALQPLEGTVVSVFLDNQSKFKAFLRRHLPDAEITEDLLYQSLLKAIRAAEDLKDKETTVGWFYRIFRNALTDFYRARAAEGRKLKGFQGEVAASGSDYTPATEEEMRTEVCLCMNRLLPALKPEYSELIRRIDLGGESASLLTGELGITPNNLQVRLHRARQALRSSLERCCGVCSKHGCMDCTCEAATGHAS